MSDFARRHCAWPLATALALGGFFPEAAYTANPRDYIEAIRAKASVVYWGVVREVDVHDRTRFVIQAKAKIEVSGVARPASSSAAKVVTIAYSSFDDALPAMDGPPQYRLTPGARVLVFADSMRAGSSPRYLVSGTEADLVRAVEALRNTVRAMSAADMRTHEITEQERKTQLALYEEILARFISATS